MSDQMRTLEKDEGSADDDHRALMENALDSTPNAAAAVLPFVTGECQKPGRRATATGQQADIPEFSATRRGESTPSGGTQAPDDRSGPGSGSTREQMRARAAARKPATPAWMAESGDELFGTFIGWSEGPTKRDERHKIAVVETESGERLFYTVLLQEFEDADPRPGDSILIERADDRVGPNGNYRVYRVTVDRAGDSAGSSEGGAS